MKIFYTPCVLNPPLQILQCCQYPFWTLDGAPAPRTISSSPLLAHFSGAFCPGDWLVPTSLGAAREFQGRGSLVGCRQWGRTQSDTTEVTQQQQQQGLCCAMAFGGLFSISMVPDISLSNASFPSSPISTLRMTQLGLPVYLLAPELPYFFPYTNAPSPVESREAPPTSSFPGFSEPP